VADRSFREDLYYRLNVFPIHVPALRVRRDDIPLLADAFVRRLARRMNKALDGVSLASMAKLQRHDWPGNVRELQNVLERAAILATGPLLEVSLTDEARPVSSHAPAPRGDGMQDVERAHILHVLGKTNGVVGGPNGAATRLGMKRSTLNFRMKKFGIARTR